LKKHSSTSSSPITGISKARCGKPLQPLLIEFDVEEDDAGKRLDVYLADQDDPPLSRSQVKKAIDSGDVLVDAKRVKAGHTLREGERVSWLWTPVIESLNAPEDIPLDLLYDDEHFAIVDKPAGMVVHPSPGHPTGTLVNALLHRFDQLSGVGGVKRPGIVHRIDKDTSGALAVSKTDVGHRHLSALFKSHDIKREYHALVFGPSLPDTGTISTLYGRKPNDRIRFSSKVADGKPAITHFKVMERFDHGAALVICTLRTGRTHQIRVHLADMNSPLLGDQLYGGQAAAASRLISRQALHARTLGFQNLDGVEVLCNAPYPIDFQLALESLRQGRNWR